MGVPPSPATHDVRCRHRRLRRAVHFALGALSVAACGGAVARDGERPGDVAGGATSTTNEAGSAGVDVDALTCGDWLAAVELAAETRCGWSGVSFSGYDEARPLDPSLAEQVCFKNVEEKDCMAPDPEFIADECEAACAR